MRESQILRMMIFARRKSAADAIAQPVWFKINAEFMQKGWHWAAQRCLLAG